VGFGVVAVDDASAATVASVTITTPADSGALRGIDSTFVVSVKVRDFTPIERLGCVIYLIKDNVATAVIEDEAGKDHTLPALAGGGAITTPNHAAPATITFGGMPEISTIIIASGGRGSISTAVAGDVAAGAVTGTTSGRIIAAHTFKGLSSGSFSGDGDSLASATVGDTTTFTWYGRIHFSSGTVTGVHAAAFAIDDATNALPTVATADTSVIVKSATSLKFGVDADRPTDPAAMVFSTSSTVTARGLEGNKVGTTYHQVTGFTSAANAQVLGIGDTIKVNVTLGNQTDPVLGADSLSVVADLFGKVTSLSKGARSADTLQHRVVLAEGDYTGRVGADNATATDTFGVFIVDLAGNRSGVADAAPTGVTLPVTYFVDVTPPVLDGQVVAGDTILPVSTDTITDGGLNTGFSNDLNPITYTLAEALDTLFVTFDGATDVKLKIVNTTLGLADAALKAGSAFTIDMTAQGDTATATDSFFVSGGGAVTEFDGTTFVTGGKQVTTGMHTITFQGIDLAGNLGPALARTNVYVDVDDLELIRLFPTAASGLDTLEQETAKVIFQLSEAADSVLITYSGIAGGDNGNTRTRPLVGSELTNTTAEQTFPVESLVTDTQYTLQIVGADLAGNYMQTSLDSFVYDTTFVVPVIAQFAITANVAKTGTGNSIAAGDTLILTLTAKTVDDKVAVTYKEATDLKITGGSGLTLTGTGVTDAGNGRATLSADDWVVGTRTVVLKDTISVDTLSVAVQDCTDTTSIYVGVLDSIVIVNPAAYSQIVVDAGEVVGQGDDFPVALTLADKYGNVRGLDDGFVSVSANKLGVQVPVGEVPINNGVGSFMANSATWSGTGLVLTVRDVIINDAPVAAVIVGTDTIEVNGDGATVLDAPDTVIAKDYMGASGAGDQGGFITLSFPVSDDHATLTAYRIYRKVAVSTGLDATGALVTLAAPVMEMISWGSVDAVPGASVMHVVVATLDGDSTVYGVAAERGSLTTAKSAFDADGAVGTPYELMAQTMVQSREASEVSDAPVFATLSPEALAFQARGVAPRMNVASGLEKSRIALTAEAVRSVDNIAPQAVPSMLALDTAGDAGSSITVTWAKSADDRMVSSTVTQAVGPTSSSNVFTTAGVKNYNVYRKVGDDAPQLVGQAGPGETSFVDATVFNGVRYDYQVAPIDADNIAETDLWNSAMAIRNNVRDVKGELVLGLFGVDNKVDYDDFFIFADHFGLQAGEGAFDPAFDLVADNQVNFADFFVFADNFGRTVVGTGKVVPEMAGLNTDARFNLAAGEELPRVGEEIAIAVNLENYTELRGYGFTVSYDSDVLEFVGSRVDNNILGEAGLAEPHLFAQADGQVSIASFGQTATEGDLGLSLVFRAAGEIESSYIDITEGALQDGRYGVNRVTEMVSVRIETRPEVYSLSDNYPNPFNPETTIKYQLPEAGDVNLEVYNMLGQVVRTLVSTNQNAGRYVLQWDATNDSGHPLSSGIYFYRIQAGGEFQSVKKMLLLK